MLCLSRKKNETICIGDDIRVTVTQLKGDKVRIGIEAPKHIKVDRKEIRDKINAEQSANDSDCD